jgi:hypothetical protein
MVTTIAWIVLMASVAQPGHWSAPQSVSPAGAAYVAIMLVDALPEGDGAVAMIVRTPAAAPYNFILVTNRTTPVDLAHAVNVLQRSRAVHGDELLREMRAPIRRDRATNRVPNIEQATRDLNALRSAPSFEVPGIGHYPGII